MTSDAAQHARRSRRAAALPRSFYDRATEVVARELLGAIVECDSSEGPASGRIVETEAYVGEHDLACHAASGYTPRTAPLYGAPGHAYVYFIYGMYWCFNAVTRAEGLPSAVLIRAVEPVDGQSLMAKRRGIGGTRRLSDLTSGPGKLCRALGIDGTMNRHPLQSPPLTVRRGLAVPDCDVTVTPRIGITLAADWPLRWLISDNPFVSKTPPHFSRRPFVP
jgi:DNA-3-methyladenine glycosylase